MNTHLSEEKKCVPRQRQQSTAVTYETLLEIRAIVQMSNKPSIVLARKSVLVDDLVQLLHKPNEKMLDLTLSILGNCCLDTDFRKEVSCNGIAAPLASILMNISKDSIQCRACRLAGTLARDPLLAEELIKEKVVISITSALDVNSNSSRATKQMAVRALRMLWSVEEQRSHMLQCKAVHAVTLLLPWNMNIKEDLELLRSVLKALVVFSYRCSDQCALQIQGDGASFEHLIHLISNDCLKRHVLIVICNLCHASNSRPVLGGAGAVRIIIEELSNHEQNNIGLYAELAMALCYLCRESVNRAKIRHAGGLRLMLKIIHGTSISFQSIVLHALTMFMYDDAGLQELLQDGLIEILVKKIAEFVKNHGKTHKQKWKCAEHCTDSRNKRRETTDSSKHSYHRSTRDSHISLKAETEAEALTQFRANSPSYQAVVQEQSHSVRCSPLSQSCSGQCVGCSPNSPTMKGSSHDRWYYSGDWSPGSPSNMCITPDALLPQKRFWGGSPSQDSSGLSPQPSLSSRTDDEFDYPEMYSPICYDVGDDDGDDENACEEYDNDNEDDELDNRKVLNSVADSKQVTADGELSSALVLLSRISYMDNPVEDLASVATLTVLLDYITLIENSESRAQRILQRIIRNHHYFMSLLLQRFVLTIQSRLCQPQHSLCWVCDEFKLFGSSLFTEITTLAHSGFGEGELAYQLLKAEEPIQRILAVSIPYVVRVNRILWKLLVECGGLKTLINILDSDRNVEDDLLDCVPMSLNLLALSLDIPFTHHHMKCSLSHGSESLEHELEMQSSADTESGTKKVFDDEVFLHLDDGNVVPVSKNYLCSLSPVFQAMFKGGFKESNELNVTLPGISYRCLMSLFHMVKHGYFIKSISNIDLETCLELATVLDRFLLPGSDHVTEMIVKKFLSPDTVTNIYVKCVQAGDISHFHTLRHDTIRFLLAPNTTLTEAKKMFQDILQTQYKNLVLSDINDIIQEKLKTVQNKQ